jgi:hypothetical protein
VLELDLADIHTVFVVVCALLHYSTDRYVELVGRRVASLLRSLGLQC